MPRIGIENSSFPKVGFVDDTETVGITRFVSIALANFHDEIARNTANQSLQPAVERGAMTIIEIRPHHSGWKVFEAPGVEPVFREKRQATDYAEPRVLSGR
jgi:hypothetical protein